MTPRKLNVMFASFAYAGNGGYAAIHPAVADWLVNTVPRASKDERIGEVNLARFNDTPITMTRNRSILEARKGNFDVLVMVDSDMWPDLYLGNPDLPSTVPFFDTAFDFIYDNYDKAPMVVGTPYVGPPPDECVFVFRYRTFSSDHSDDNLALKMYTREEAFAMSGIQPCSALPTGLIMYDMRVFDLIEPEPDDMQEKIAGPLKRRIKDGNDKFTVEDIDHIVWQVINDKRKLDNSFTYYEWDDKYQASKASTEDVTLTRDISQYGWVKYNRDIIHCAWSSWPGHIKPKVCGRPHLIPGDAVSDKFRRAMGRFRTDQAQEYLHTSIADEYDWSRVPVMEDVMESIEKAAKEAGATKLSTNGEATKAKTSKKAAPRKKTTKSKSLKAKTNGQRKRRTKAAKARR